MGKPLHGVLMLEARVSCNDCHCHTNILAAAGIRTRREMEQYLRKGGWRIRKGRWVCGICAKPKPAKLFPKIRAGNVHPF